LNHSFIDRITIDKSDDPFVAANDNALPDKAKADAPEKKIRGVARQQNFGWALCQVILKSLRLVIGNGDHLDAGTKLILEFGERFHFRKAGCAPGTPEIKYDNFVWNFMNIDFAFSKIDHRAYQEIWKDITFFV
jgi:hypothetical protein